MAFIKTSTGFAQTGATEDAVKTMRKLARPGLKIKASGGIKTAEDFRRYVELGAARVGASQSVSILQELERPQWVLFPQCLSEKKEMAVV